MSGAIYDPAAAPDFGTQMLLFMAASAAMPNYPVSGLLDEILDWRLSPGVAAIFQRGDFLPGQIDRTINDPAHGDQVGHVGRGGLVDPVIEAEAAVDSIAGLSQLAMRRIGIADGNALREIADHQFEAAGQQAGNAPGIGVGHAPQSDTRHDTAQGGAA